MAKGEDPCKLLHLVLLRMVCLVGKRATESAGRGSSSPRLTPSPSVVSFADPSLSSLERVPGPWCDKVFTRAQHATVSLFPSLSLRDGRPVQLAQGSDHFPLQRRTKDLTLLLAFSLLTVFRSISDTSESIRERNPIVSVLRYEVRERGRDGSEREGEMRPHA